MKLVMSRTVVSAAIIVLSLFMLLWRAKIAGKGEFFDNYFPVSQTRSIKGICAVFILFSHMCPYLGDTFTALFTFKYVGAIMVAAFFLVSGYGLQYGIMNKENYLKGFLGKRMLSIAVPFYIINIFYIVSGPMDTKSILISLTGYNVWFVMAIAIFYAGFYICNRLLSKNVAMVAITVFTLLYMLVMNRLHMGFWWYNSCLLFPAGIWLCRYSGAFVKFFKKHCLLKTLLLVAVVVICYAYYCIHSGMADTSLTMLAMSVLTTVSFGVMLAVLSMKVQLKNPILDFFGDMSLEIYLTHALWIGLLRSEFCLNLAPAFFGNDVVYLVGILVGTIVMSMLSHKVSGLILKLILRKPENKQP